MQEETLQEYLNRIGAVNNIATKENYNRFDRDD